MADNLRNTLIRAWSMDMKVNHGNVVVAEVLRRNVDAPVDGRFFPFHNGAVLIDADAAIGPIARMCGRNGYLITIRDTAEFLWCPIAAHLAAGDYWTVEMVPWVEFQRQLSLPDAEIIRRAHDGH